MMQLVPYQLWDLGQVSTEGCSVHNFTGQSK